MCVLTPDPPNDFRIHTTQKIRMRATQLRIKRLSMRRPDNVFTLLHPCQKQHGIRNHATLGRRFKVHSATCLASDPQCCRVLSIGSNGITTLSLSKFHRPKHCLVVLQFPTHQNETRARRPNTAQHCCCSFHSRHNCETLKNEVAVRFICQPFVLVVFRQSVVPL